MSTCQLEIKIIVPLHRSFIIIWKTLALIFNPVVKAKLRNRTNLTETALACDRLGISSRKASLLCNSFAKDCGFLKHENCLTATLDASNLDQWRKKERWKAKERDEAEISSRPVISCYFDGKKTATLVQKNREKWENIPKNQSARPLCHGWRTWWHLSWTCCPIFRPWNKLCCRHVQVFGGKGLA